MRIQDCGAGVKGVDGVEASFSVKLFMKNIRTLKRLTNVKFDQNSSVWINTTTSCNIVSKLAHIKIDM